MSPRPLFFSSITLCLFLVGCSSTPSLMENAERNPAQSKSFQQDLEDRYKEQAAGFSDEVLIANANGPDWGWLWLKPHHVLGEIDNRASLSSKRALSLSFLFLKSFEQKEDMQGTHVHNIFLSTLSKAVDVDRINEDSITLGRTLEKLSKILRDEEDLHTIAQAKEIYFRNFLVHLMVKLRQEDQSFEEKLRFLRFLDSALDPSNELLWLTRKDHFFSNRSLLLNHLFLEGQSIHFESLKKYYLNQDPDLNLPQALVGLYRMSNQKTLSLVEERLATQLKGVRSIAEISKELGLIKYRFSAEHFMYLQPTLLKLLSQSEERKDLAGISLIKDTLNKFPKHLSTLKKKITNESEKIRWEQIKNFSYANQSCLEMGQATLALYQRELLAPNQISLAIRELASDSCAEKSGKKNALQILSNVCEEAYARIDSSALQACFSEVFQPLSFWLLTNRELETAEEISKKFLSRFYQWIPKDLKAQLNTSCRLRILNPQLYVYEGENRRKLTEASVRFIYRTLRRLFLEDCTKIDSSDSLVIDRKLAPPRVNAFSKNEDGFIYNWSNHQSADPCVADILEDKSFLKISSYLNLLTPMNKDNNIPFWLRGHLPLVSAETVLHFPNDGSRIFSDSCIRE